MALSKNRRRLLVAVALLVVAGGAYAVFRPRAAESALEVGPSPLEWGEIPRGEVPERAIRIRNRSAHDVVLKSVFINCSCFSFKNALGVVQLRPGASTDLVAVLYSPKSEPGRFHKTLTVESDDPVTPKLEIPVLGSVIEMRSIVPSRLDLGAVAADKPVEQTVRVRGGAGFLVEVKDVKPDDPRVVVETKSAESGADLVVRVKAGSTKGAVRSTVRMTLVIRREGNDRPLREFADSFAVTATLP